MSFLKNIWQKIFGDNNNAPKQPTVTSTSQSTDYFSKWQKERANLAEANIKDWLLAHLQKKEMSFSWESGNDEAFVYFDDFTDAEEDQFTNLEEYIINKLDIPDAGEFNMNGSGIIFIEGNTVKAKYQSLLKNIVDFNEETEEEIYGEAESDSGEKVLMTFM